MDLFKKRLFSSIIGIVFCIGFSSEEFGDWFSDNNNENVVTPEDSSTTSITAQILPSTSSVSSIFSSISTTSSPETRSTSTSTIPPTFSTTSSTIASTSITTSSTPPSTSPSTKLFTRPSTIPSTLPTTKLYTVASTSFTQWSSALPLISSTLFNTSTDETPKNSSEKPIECLKIELNAKIIFKYKSNEGSEQEFEIIGGNTNGELTQPDKCLRNQTLVIKYDLVEKTQLILGISFSDTEFSIKRIRFEYPFYRLPDDFDKENHSEEVHICSADRELNGKCLVVENNDLIHYSLNYKINDQIYCKELPLIVLNNNKTSIDILLKDFRLVISDSQSNAVLTQTSDEFCPLNTINSEENELDAMFAGSSKIWVGVSYAVVGAIIMFGFAFIYEKFVRERLFYKPIDREEPDV